ncbi:hypothetical protein [Vibrio bathopelagicus]|uniref:hypothetical protein n=1 Tax=Vibrio bathopelagicus TaxID=2777577 RepID=UPI0018653267|nr:hypothetical protein [Vibrio bathopelagicus]
MHDLNARIPVLTHLYNKKPLKHLMQDDSTLSFRPQLILNIVLSRRQHITNRDVKSIVQFIYPTSMFTYRTTSSNAAALQR